MGNTNNYERIRIALDELRDSLAAFVEGKMRESYGDEWQKRYAIPDWSDGFNTDVAVLTNTIVNNWQDVFSKCFKREAKHLVHQVRKTRNRFAHQERFDPSDTYSALHEMQRLLEAIGSDTAKSIERSKSELVHEMADPGESPEDVARKAEAAADDALAKFASEPHVSARLVMLRRGQPSEVEFVLELPAVIGRADASVGAIDIDLTEYEESAYVSRRHAKIAVVDGTFVIEDLGSSNGTYIKRGDYEKVDRAELADGDEVAFGNAKFVFRVDP